MTELLSPERVAEIRDSPLSTSHITVLALCDTVESLRTEIERLHRAVGEQTTRGDRAQNRAKTLEGRVRKARDERDRQRELRDQVHSAWAANQDELETLRAERDELVEVLVEGAMDDDELVAGLRAKHEARKLRGADRE